MFPYTDDSRKAAGVLGDATNLYTSPTFPRLSTKSADRSAPVDVYFEHSTATRKLTEPQILANLEYALVGEPSELFVYTENGVQLPAGLELSLSQQLRDFIEPACIYRALRQLILDKSCSSMVKLGLFCAIEKQLILYQQTMNEIFQNYDLNLNELYTFLRPKIDCLRYLWFLANNLESQSPNDLLSLVFNFIGGDVSLAKISQQILVEMVAPFHELMCSWLQTGDLSAERSHQEGFFVASTDEYGVSSSSKHVTASNSQFLADRVPTFLSVESAKQIYEIGKTLNYLLYTCGQKAQVHDFALQFRQSDICKSPEMIFSPAFQQLIRSQHKRVISYLNEIIHKDLNLVKELHVLRDVMLMGRSDFIEKLVTSSNEVLSRASLTIHPQQLSTLLQESLRQTSVVSLPDEYKHRIDAILFDQENGKVGWDLYTLDFKVRQELELIVCHGKRSAKEYLRMFNFLLKLHRCCYELNNNFQKASLCKKYFSKKLSLNLRRVQKRMHDDPSFSLSTLEEQCVWLMENQRRFDALRSRMLTFANQLSLFFDEDVIRPGFDKLMNSLHKNPHTLFKGFARTDRVLPLNPEVLQKIVKVPEDIDTRPSEFNEQTLDELSSLHQTYITSISRCTLLQHSSKASVGRVSSVYYFQHIQSLLRMILQFCDLDREFYSAVSDLVSTIQLRSIGDSDEPLSLFHTSLEEDLRQIVSSRGNLENTFNRTKSDFTQDLKADIDVKLQLLGCRI